MLLFGSLQPSCAFSFPAIFLCRKFSLFYNLCMCTKLGAKRYFFISMWSIGFVRGFCSKWLLSSLIDVERCSIVVLVHGDTDITFGAAGLDDGGYAEHGEQRIASLAQELDHIADVTISGTML